MIVSVLEALMLLWFLLDSSFAGFEFCWIQILLVLTIAHFDFCWIQHFAGLDFCWIQVSLDSTFGGFNFCWIQDLLALLVLCAGIQAPQTDAFDRCPT